MATKSNTMLASTALATINVWEANSAIDIMLSTVAKTYKRKSHTVTQWAADLAERRIWRGSGIDSSRTKVRITRSIAAAKKRKPARRKLSRSKTPSKMVSAAATPAPLPHKVWTKDQREEAARKKSEEVDEAETRGLRRSRRSRVPSEKVLDGQ